MKKYILLASFFTLVVGINITMAQSRKYVSQFSHIQGYLNPALTGYEGSTVRGFVRNQWSGFDGAPKTYFASVDFDLAEFSNRENAALEGKNAAGINFLADQYGSFQETELVANYAARIRISNSTNFRMGFGVNFNSVRLDGNNLSTEEQNDPIVNKYNGSFANMNMIDFNLGAAITHNKFYLSYALSNVNKGGISSGDVFIENRPRVSIFQAGFRSRVGDNVSVATNAIYRLQKDLPYNLEINFKMILKDVVWLGAGHREGLSNNFQAGFILPKLRLGYAYEVPMINAYLLPASTHEFMAMFPIFSNYKKNLDRPLLIW